MHSTYFWRVAILPYARDVLTQGVYRTRVRSLAMLVSNSVTPWRLVNMIDVTLACEDAYSKLVEVVTVADVSDEDCVGNSLLQIWKLRFGHKA